MDKQRYLKRHESFWNDPACKKTGKNLLSDTIVINKHLA